MGVQFAAGPPQGKNGPLGGQRSVGVQFSAGPPQGKSGPRGGQRSVGVRIQGTDHFAQKRRHHQHAAALPGGRGGAGVDIQRPEFGCFQHVNRMQRTGCNPDRTRGRHDVGHFVGGGRGYLQDAAGAIGQLRPGVAVRFKVGVGRHAAGAHPYRPLPAGCESIGVADRHEGAADL